MHKPWELVVGGIGWLVIAGVHVGAVVVFLWIVWEASGPR